MNNEIQFIVGGNAKDFRGEIRFVNDFDMTEVKRFYIIKNDSSEIIRGWRGHKMEKRWFYVLNGEFSVDIVKIDNWEKPNNDLVVEKIRLSAEAHQVLMVPEGHATAFQAIIEGSELLVFANYGIENAVKDDFVWDLEYFHNRKSI